MFPCVSKKAFAFLIGIPIGITSSAIGLKICTITVSLAKSNLNRKEVLIYKSLTDSNISRNEVVSINNVLKEYEEVKEKIKNLNI